MMESCRGCLHEHLESEECVHCSRAYTDEYEARTLISNVERIRNMTDRCEADRCVDCVSDWLRTEN